jgi:hypothetical protein
MNAYYSLIFVFLQFPELRHQFLVGEYFAQAHEGDLVDSTLVLALRSAFGIMHVKMPTIIGAFAQQNRPQQNRLYSAKFFRKPAMRLTACKTTRYSAARGITVKANQAPTVSLSSPVNNQTAECARGLVSERCGGNRLEW